MCRVGLKTSVNSPTPWNDLLLPCSFRNSAGLAVPHPVGAAVVPLAAVSAQPTAVFAPPTAISAHPAAFSAHPAATPRLPRPFAVEVVIPRPAVEALCPRPFAAAMDFPRAFVAAAHFFGLATARTMATTRPMRLEATLRVNGLRF